MVTRKCVVCGKVSMWQHNFGVQSPNHLGMHISWYIYYKVADLQASPCSSFNRWYKFLALVINSAGMSLSISAGGDNWAPPLGCQPVACLVCLIICGLHKPITSALFVHCLLLWSLRPFSVHAAASQSGMETKETRHKGTGGKRLSQRRDATMPVKFVK